MSKLSQPLKALINAAQFKPNTTPAPQHIAAIYESIAKDALSKGVGVPAWLCASTAATMTMNSPESLLQLHKVASASQPSEFSEHSAAELMREVGLKCIGFNGIPRTINCLNAFRDGLPDYVQTALQQRRPQRNLETSNIEETISRGRSLWDSIYHPVTDKLTKRLASSHPDLPVYIIESAYGALFTDPTEGSTGSPQVGRILTSIIAVTCLRAQTGVGPQVVSHVFGLRKAFEDGSAEREETIKGSKWLASDEGSIWLLQCADKIVEALGGTGKTTFAAGYKAKL